MYRYILLILLLRIPPTRASAQEPILAEIPGIDFLRSLTATKVGNPEDIDCLLGKCKKHRQHGFRWAQVPQYCVCYRDEERVRGVTAFVVLMGPCGGK